MIHDVDPRNSSAVQPHANNVKDDLEDPIDVFGSALNTIFTIEPLTAILDQSQTLAVRGITVAVPSPDATNWALQADSIWRSCVYLTDNVPDARGKTVLELGAGTGLVGLMCASEGGATAVVLTDYPDQQILMTLGQNVGRNDLESRVRVAGHKWGDDDSLDQILSSGHPEGFDVVVGSDLLWMRDQHLNICLTLSRALKRSLESSAHFVAGFHTGRYPIVNFVEEAKRQGLRIENIREVSVTEKGKERSWDPDREEQVLERRRWLVVIILKW
ncbi:hypothetical protein FRB96_004546 [Tulasnella sp. 330]|nr:hypothetical protein FRB96_004546 [Tulasnella sp. 330]KAG8885669.1 hypothetical protein FRB97_000112 [Tulasnella sp. 331]KAG8890831.1 hypothetical protein FRB98_004876 [Tulasnella sp. 332]